MPGQSIRICNKSLLPFVVLLLMVGCTPVPPRQASVSAPSDADAPTLGWWKVSFEIAWPKGQPPRWYMDTLLAHRVIAPVLQHHRPDIRLWRFHRRAARDGHGHRFAFLFYSRADVAYRILQAIRETPFVAALLAEKELLRVDYSDPRHNEKPGIGDTSDPHWSAIVQKTWPHFIMGASEMWLGLIEENVAALEEDGETEDRMLFEKVQSDLDQFWREAGQHPFLHHLNALFAYEEMLIVDRNGKAMRF